MKFDKLREQLIERTATNQAMDLLDAGIIAVANAYSDIAADEIESLREAEQRIHDKISACNSKRSMQPRVQRVSGMGRVGPAQVSSLNSPAEHRRYTDQYVGHIPGSISTNQQIRSRKHG
jgi:hypothetical protein